MPSLHNHWVGDHSECRPEWDCPKADGEMRDPPTDTSWIGMEVHKVAGFVPLSVEMAMDNGMITEEEARAHGWTPTVYPPVPLLRRLRWRWQALRERVGRQLGGWIAGVDLSERDE